jgi:hypothetical protein
MKKLTFFFIALLSYSAVSAQVSVVNIPLMSYSITPESMLSASLMNAGSEQQVSMTSKLYNLNNELLLVVKSAAFSVKPGLNAGYGSRKAMAVEYGSGKQADYIRTSHGLPSGVFKICVDIQNALTLEPSDEFCDEIQSEFNQYLYLVFPMDKEVIPTTSPLLTWSHSEPFNILAQGESYRMIVAEIKHNQTPEEALLLNSPVMLKDYLTSHSLQYPYEAKPLEQGKSYSWQVQKLANGVVLNKTETWEFKILNPDATVENKYATLRKVLDASFYTAENNKIFFRFQEEYTSGALSFTIYDSKRKPLEAKATNESVKKSAANYKYHGFNQYEIDLNGYDVSKGFYTLEVQAGNNELLLLKFYIP